MAVGAMSDSIGPSQTSLFFSKKKASWHRAVGAMSDSIGAFSDSIVVAQRENGAKSALGALAAAANSRADTRPDRLRCVCLVCEHVCV